MQCDRCNANAYVFVTIDNGLPLSFCGHHYAANEEALMAYAIDIDDQRALLKA